ncbi:WD40/YVTN/BNR-like repeat-containing protein [Streptomyces sp. NPDC050516]|uniref:WD40/YVTN/BNR-like repeat-containing protein n=1 Tax=Streptomyces sp. NPDC050516 TaxID=3365621 RepID=UPI003792F670
MRGRGWSPEDLTAGRDIAKLALVGDDLVFQPAKEGVLYTVRNAAGKPKPPTAVFTPKSKQVLASWDAAGHTIAALVLGSGGGLVISADAGRTWGDPIQDLSGGTVVVSASGTGDQILHQADRGARLYTGNGRFLRVDLPADTVSGFCQLPDGAWLAADPVHGLYSTTDWSDYTRVGVPAAVVTALAVSGRAILAGTETGMRRTALPIAGPNWDAPEGLFVSGNHIVDISVSAANQSLVWRTRRVNLTCAADRSTDAGMTWQERGSWPDAIFAVHIDPHHPDRVMHSFGCLDADSGREILGVRTTSDGSDSWDEHDHGRFYLDLVADPLDEDRVWMASSTNGLYYSRDFGQTAQLVTPHEANTVLSTGSRLLIGGDTIRYSDDGGTTFHPSVIESGQPIRAVALAQHGKALFAATASIWFPGTEITAGRGVLRSVDNGTTWRSVSGNLRNLDVRALAVDPEGPSLYAGLHGGSVYRLPL